jgi:alanine-glyoxylate transaminase / serine-glyoxylate transaminase / serine-pyruvate transaminase
VVPSVAMRPLLMIPGPIEISPAVQAAFGGPPTSHVAPDFIERCGRSLERMRAVWAASSDSQPFILAGSGTIAMEMGACNVVGPGDRVLLVNTGFFSDRMATMLRRRGATVDEVTAPVGHAPSLDAVRQALEGGDYRALFATHVDTSTGVRADAEGLARLANERELISVFDGVCATGAERFEMEAWGADVYLTASQKAIGLPAGLALLVMSPRALRAREALAQPPPMALDVQEWTPIMRAYEERRPSYFSTPATNLVSALDVGLGEILETEHRGHEGIEARWSLHAAAADAMRAALSSLGLSLLPEANLAANTLSAVRYPKGVDASLVGAIKAAGVVVAGGLHPACKAEYFRVGHMGHSATQREHLLRTIEALGSALAGCIAGVDGDAAALAAGAVLDGRQ